MRMLFRNERYWLLKIVLGYVFLGSIYFLSGYIYNHSIGNEIIFSPIIAFPLVLMGWPMMLCADIIHVKTLGLQPHSILTLFMLVIVLFLFLWKGINQMNQGNKPKTE